MSLEDVIAGSLADARAEGVIPEVGDEGVVTVEPEEGETAVVEGEEKPAVVEGEETTETKTPIEEEEVKIPVVPEKEKKTEDEDPLAKDIGPALDKQGRVNRIPHPRVAIIAANAAKRAVDTVVSTVAKAMGVDVAKITPETLESSITTALGEVTELRSKIAGFENLTPIIEREGDRFIRMLAATNPAQYSKFVDFLDGKGGGEEKPVVRTPATEEPGPDIKITLPNGQEGMTYSVEGLKKRDAWLREQTLLEVDARLDKRVKPFEDRRADEQKEAATQEQMAIAVKNVLTEAREDWDGFAEHEKDIQAAMKDVPKNVPFARALRQAWQKVVVSKLKTTKATMRTELIAEAAKAPKSTSVPSAGTKPVKTVMRDEDGQVIDGTLAVIHKAVADAKAAGLK